MVEKPDRYRVGDQTRDAVEDEWEVFVRAAAEQQLQHAGSVTAPSADVAYEQAAKLFAWYASDVWVCPASALHRYSTHALDDDAEPVELDEGTEDRIYEA